MDCADPSLDAETILRAARRPLVVGIGGGGDVVGALGTAELLRRHDGADPIVGGLTWERGPIDPVPGPRGVDEIADGQRSRPESCLPGRAPGSGAGTFCSRNPGWPSTSAARRS